MEPNTKIRNFKDLIAWQEAHKLVLETYKLINIFPKSERFVLSNQLSRAVISVSSNLAEGFSRQSKKEKIQFYFVASASLTEVENQLIIAKDIKYISIEQFESIVGKIHLVQRLISGLVRSIRKSYS